MMIKNILVPVDGSKYSFKAFNAASRYSITILG